MDHDPELERFHFDPSFEVVVGPSYPGDGDWRCPYLGYDRDGSVQDDAPTTWGPPLVVEVTTRDGKRWVGAFAASGLGGVTGVFATPSPNVLAVVNDGLAYLVDIDAPHVGAGGGIHQVIQVEAVATPDLLLLVRFTKIDAIGPTGPAWSSGRVAVDDLRVISTDGGAIVCTLDNLGGSETITLDAASGEQIGGTRLNWPRGAQ